jgi:pimeloyl-ACP methyl ester carboxylesterase
VTTPAPATVVLVHGAFADGSSWGPVISRLQSIDIPVVAVPNPLRGLTADGEYVASAVNQIEGPVVLVGHSYGGPVITYAATKTPNARALVFVASFGVEKGVTTLGSVEGFPEVPLGSALAPHPYPTADGTGTEFTIQVDKFADVFAADLPAEQVAVLAASQRPAADIAFGEPLSVEPAWRNLPCWFAIATADHAIHPESQHFAAEKMTARTVVIEGGSHAIALSHPDEVANLIVDAVKDVGRQ